MNIIKTTKEAATLDRHHMGTRLCTGNHTASPTGLMRSRTKTIFILLLFVTRTESVDP